MRKTYALSTKISTFTQKVLKIIIGVLLEVRTNEANADSDDGFAHRFARR